MLSNFCDVIYMFLKSNERETIMKTKFNIFMCDIWQAAKNGNSLYLKNANFKHDIKLIHFLAGCA